MTCSQVAYLPTYQMLTRQACDQRTSLGVEPSVCMHTLARGFAVFVRFSPCVCRLSVWQGFVRAGWLAGWLAGKLIKIRYLTYASAVEPIMRKAASRKVVPRWRTATRVNQSPLIHSALMELRKRQQDWTRHTMLPIVMDDVRRSPEHRSIV
jgi:hypothetical protein